MISAVAILMLCNGIRIFLKSKKNTINEIGCVMEFMTHLFRFFIFSFLHFFVSSFFSSDFTDESEAFLLIGLLTEFRGTLAAGQWLAPDICSCCFLSRRFRRYTQIFLCVDYFVTQISQMTQIFLCVDYFVTQISQMTQIFLCGDYFVQQISQIYTDFSLWDIFQFQGVSAPTGQVASAKIHE